MLCLTCVKIQLTYISGESNSYRFCLHTHHFQIYSCLVPLLTTPYPTSPPCINWYTVGSLNLRMFTPWKSANRKNQVLPIPSSGRWVACSSFPGTNITNYHCATKFSGGYLTQLCTLSLKYLYLGFSDTIVSCFCLFVCFFVFVLSTYFLLFAYTPPWPDL